MHTMVEHINGIAGAWWPPTAVSTLQGLVVLALVAGILLLWRKASPRWRYGLLLVALVKFCLPPVGTSFGLFHWLPVPEISAPPPIRESAVPVAGGPLKAETFDAATDNPEPAARFFVPPQSPDRITEETALSPAVFQSVPRVQTAPPPHASPVSLSETGTAHRADPRISLTPAGWVFVVQILGSLGMVILVLGQAVRLQRRVGRAERVSGGRLFDIASETGRRFGLKRLPAMHVDGDLRSPQTGGILRPFVLLPRWIEEADEDERAALVSHELAHVVRRDSWINWFQIVTQAWLWWNPFVWWLNRRIRVEREVCCDDLVLGLGMAEGESYSRTLLGVAGRLTRREATMQVLGMADTFVSLKSRVSRILDASVRRPVRMSIVSVAALAVFALLVLPGSSPARWDGDLREVAVHDEKAGDAGADDAGSENILTSSDSEPPVSSQDAEAPDHLAPPRGAGRSFDGVKDFLEVPDSGALDIGDYFTVELWVKARGVTGEDSILSKEVPWKSGWTVLAVELSGGDTSSGTVPILSDDPEMVVDQRLEGGNNAPAYTFSFAVGNGTRFRDLYLPSFVEEQAWPAIGFNEWHHVAATWERGTGSVYVDGRFVASQVFPGAAPARVPLRIGEGSADLGRQFNGELAEIRIWDVVRTPEEIEANITKTLTGKEPGLVACWPLDDPPEMVARDLSPYNRYARPRSTEETNYLGQKDYPRIVNLDPPQGAKNVDPARDSITVSFDRPMRDGYSWVDKGQRPKMDRPEWINDHQCRAHVTLEPDRNYALWLNFGPRTSHFRSVEGVSSNRFYWTFSTGGGSASEAAEVGFPGHLPGSEAAPAAVPTGENLLDSMVSERGCEVTKEDGFVVLTEGTGDTSYIRTPGSYRPPFVVKTRAMTDSTNIRLYYGDYSGPASKCGIVIFDWELDPNQLRVHHPLEYNIQGVPEEGYVAPGEWHDMEWEIRPDVMVVRADGKERCRLPGDYAAAEGTLGIGPAWGSKVSVQSFVVEAGTPGTTTEANPRQDEPREETGASAPPPESQEVGAAPDQEPVPEGAECLGPVDDTAEGKKSLGASGHAVEFERPDDARFVEAVRIAAERYGTAIPPAVDFHLYVLDGEQRVLADVPFPYAMIERGKLQWYTLRTPSIEVPERFFVSLAFNPHQTKGVYLGMDTDVSETHSYTGLPGGGFDKVTENYDWMVRPCLSKEPTGVKGTMLLADWSPPEEIDPFKGCIEVVYDDGKSDGKQSYGGSGPAIRFRPVDFIPDEAIAKSVRLVGFRLYASRYGSGYEPDETMLDAALLDPVGEVRWSGAFPYSLFSYKEKWVDLVLPEPVPIDFSDQAEKDWILSLDPHAHQYKGIYFHYDTDLKETGVVKELSHSLMGTVNDGFQPVPDREWMIRAYFAVSDEG